jgi:hypothetical protein
LALRRFLETTELQTPQPTQADMARALGLCPQRIWQLVNSLVRCGAIHYCRETHFWGVMRPLHPSDYDPDWTPGGANMTLLEAMRR